MIRHLPILLGICVAIVSGLIGVVGVHALAHYELVSAPPMVMTFDQFATSRPKDTYHYTLTNFCRGTDAYPSSVDEAGQWEKVRVCLFSDRGIRQNANYISTIVEIEGVKGPKELATLFEKGELNVYFWPNKQQLPTDVYNRMASKYRGMLFDKCLHCESGGPVPSPDFGNCCIYIGIAGFSLSVIGVIAFFCFKSIRASISRRQDPWYDEEEEQFNNRAGLPSI